MAEVADAAAAAVAVVVADVVAVAVAVVAVDVVAVAVVAVDEDLLEVVPDSDVGYLDLGLDLDLVVDPY